MNRLHELLVDNELAGLEMKEEAERFERLATRHEDGTAPRAIAAFNLFQTPEHIADRMAAIVAANTDAGANILEPSAGLGRLYRALVIGAPLGARFTLVDNSPECCTELYAMTEDDPRATIKQGDFLEMWPAREGYAGLILKDLHHAFYDAVCMNPPFKQGRDIKHIMHALEFLHSGGVLVALCYNGKRQNAKLKPLADTWEVLPEGTFKETGTGASVCLLTIRKGGKWRAHGHSSQTVTR